MHFIAKWPYESREKNAGRLVRKDKSKSPNKKPFFNKKFSKKKRIVLVAHEEYPSDDDEEEENPNQVAAIAIASSPPSSLFESPNENSSTRNAKFFMAKASEVSLSPSTKILETKHDTTSPSVEDKNDPLINFMTK